MKWLVGIDEAGRGPLAGPVAVGVVKVPASFDWKLIPGVGDSKQVSEKNREAIFLRAKQLKKEGRLDFSVVLIAAKVIDARGIVPAINKAMSQAIQKLELNPRDCFVKLDGALRAPSPFSQETIIKGDAKEKVIGLASILAKVTRDTYMCSQDNKFPQYHFATHKGYGTKKHRSAIHQYGLSTEHRSSYCQNVGKWGSLK